MTGILLALQFFTIVPVNKQLPLGRKEVTAMYIALPFVGAAIGLAMYGVSLFMLSLLQSGPLLTALLIVLTAIVLTGGLHLDGWADTSDAFFSYRERTKRLEIMDDPRLGTFGVMSLMLLIILKIALFNEIIMRGQVSLILFVAIPFLSRVLLNLYFTTMRPTKEKGIAHFFKSYIASKVVMNVSIIIGFLAIVSVGVLTGNYLLSVVLFALLGGGLLLYRQWSMKHFGGMTGDLSGAFIEGMEVFMWFVVFALL